MTASDALAGGPVRRGSPRDGSTEVRPFREVDRGAPWLAPMGAVLAVKLRMEAAEPAEAIAALDAAVRLLGVLREDLLVQLEAGPSQRRRVRRG